MIEYKILEPDQYDFSLFGDFFQKTWFLQEKPDNGVMDFDAKDLEGTFKQFNVIFVVGAFDGDHIIGFVMACDQDLYLGEEPVKGLNPMFLAVLEEYRRQKIGTTLMQRFHEKVEELGYEIIIGGPERKYHGHQLLEKLGWIMGSKFESKVAVLDFEKLAEYKGLNILERGIGGRMVADQQKISRISEGFQEASENDYSEIIEILNSNPALIKRYWTVESYKKFLENSQNYDIKAFIWKKDDKIVATGTTTVHSIHWAKGDGHTMFLRQFGFDCELPVEDQIKIFGEIMQIAKNYEKEIIALKMPVGQHLQQVLKQAGYMGDRKGRIFIYYPISERAKNFVAEKKIKEFYFDMI